MSQDEARIVQFVKKADRSLALYCLARGLLRAVPAVALGFLVFGGVNQCIPMPSAVRQVVWSVLVLAGLALIVTGFFPLGLFSLTQKSKNLHRSASRATGRSSLRPDDLRLAAQLVKQGSIPGLSDELKDSYMARMARLLEGSSVRYCWPAWNWKKYGGAAFLILTVCGSLWAFFPSRFPFNASVLLPFADAPFVRYVKVTPGDAFTAWGKDMTIELSLLEPSVDKPVLYVKAGDHWQSVEPLQETREVRIYVFRNVVQPIDYKARWRSEWSRKYRISPVQPIRLEEFSIHIQPPGYLQTGAAQQTSPEIVGLAGSLVTLQAKANKDLAGAKIVFADGREDEAAVSEGRKISVKFSIDKSGAYGFRLKDADGYESDEGTPFPIRLLEDQLPSVALLSPDEDLIVGDKERVPLTYNAKDDFGVREILLVWEPGDKKTHRRRVKLADPAEESLLATYEWDLAQERFLPGEIIRYQIQAVDGNSVTGPGRAETQWRVLEIASFDREHASIEKALREWRDQAVDLLARVSTEKSKLDADQPNFEQLASDFNQTAQNSHLLEQRLKQIVQRMEKDPLADYGVWLEHQAMHQNLEAMNQSSVKSAQASLQMKDKSSAGASLDQMIGELERMTALSEELTKAQKARDVMEAGEGLQEAGERLMERLKEADAQGQKVDDKLRSLVNDLLAQAMKNIQDMVRSLRNMPDELPDDFVNQEALKNLDVDKSQDLLSRIQDAMSRGDMAQALKLAQEFLRASKELRNQLAKAHESYLQSRSAEDLANKIAEQEQKLEEIAEEERTILAETQKLESKRLASFLKEQEERLKKLAERQRKAVSDAQKILQKEKLELLHASVLSGQLKPMADVAQELETKLVERSPQWLAEISRQLEELSFHMEKSSAAAGAALQVKTIRAEEEAILQELQKKSDAVNRFSPADQQKFKELAEQQNALVKRTQSLRQNLQALSRKTASLSTPLMQSLSKAAGDMRGASEQLGENSSEQAQPLEEGALSQLMEGARALRDAQSAMSEMAMHQGGEGSSGGGPGIKVIPRSGGQGSAGTQTGKVRLSSADDYKPPKEFREELLESLKEKYPKVYEQIIHKYYKRLSE